MKRLVALSLVAALNLAAVGPFSASQTAVVWAQEDTGDATPTDVEPAPDAQAPDAQVSDRQASPFHVGPNGIGFCVRTVVRRGPGGTTVTQEPCPADGTPTDEAPADDMS